MARSIEDELKSHELIPEIRQSKVLDYERQAGNASGEYEDEVQSCLKECDLDHEERSRNAESATGPTNTAIGVGAGVGSLPSSEAKPSSGAYSFGGAMPPKDKPVAATPKGSPDDLPTEHTGSASEVAGLCSPTSDFTTWLMEQSRPKEADKLEAPDISDITGSHAWRSQLLNNVAVASRRVDVTTVTRWVGECWAEGAAWEKLDSGDPFLYLGLEVVCRRVSLAPQRWCSLRSRARHCAFERERARQVG
jgi:hypothetical protein